MANINDMPANVAGYNIGERLGSGTFATVYKGGDLSGFIRRQRGLPEGVARKFLRQLASAMYYLRTKNLAHMDLKPQNLLLTSRSNPALKIADFGFAQHLRDDLNMGTQFKGSPLYMAPEILKRKKYDARVDLWSIGVILYECVFGHAPFAGTSVENLISIIITADSIMIPTTHFLGRYEYDITKDCQNILHCLLRPDPRDRITFDEFFTHPFVDLPTKTGPSENSWKRALENGESGDRIHSQDAPAAVKFYIKAMDEGMVALQMSSLPDERQLMRRKLKEWLAKAESLKESLRPPERPPRRTKRSAAAAAGFEPVDTGVPSSGAVEAAYASSTVQQSQNSLAAMWMDVPEVSAAMTVVSKAESLAMEERWEEALQKWELAVESMLKLLQKHQASSRRDLLKREVTVWLSTAENVKKYIEVSGMGLSKVAEKEEAVVAVEEESDKLAAQEQCSVM